MVRRKSKQGSRKEHLNSRNARSAETPLDDVAREIIDLTILLFARRNYRRRDIQEYFLRALKSTPKWVASEMNFPEDPEDIPGEVLTRWYLRPEFSVNGSPRPLAATGRNSIASLVRSINERMDPKVILDYLVNTGSILQEQDKYLPKERFVHLRHDPRLQRIHHVQVVLSLLRTVEGNARRQKHLQRLQRVAVGAVRPDQLSQVLRELEEPANGLLSSADSILFRRSNEGTLDDEKLRVSLSVHVSENRPLPPLKRKVAKQALRQRMRRATVNKG